jgi:hypothetical protein
LLNSLNRRLTRLECALLPQPETWQEERLREQIQAGRKRVIALYGDKHFNFGATPVLPTHANIWDRLNAGRTRAHQRYLARRGANNEPETAGAIA